MIPAAPPASAAPAAADSVICLGHTVKKINLYVLAGVFAFVCIVWIGFAAAGHGALFGEILGIVIAVVVGLPIAYYLCKCLCVCFCIAAANSIEERDAARDAEDAAGGTVVPYNHNSVHPDITVHTTHVTHQVTHITPTHISQFTAHAAQSHVTVHGS
jgi:hypothetical protein